MNIATYNISKSWLSDMPASERDFFLLAGHLANELVFLSKLSVFTQINDSDGIQQKAEVSQSLFVHKTMAGKLYEGWAMIQKHYHRTGIAKDYNEIYDDETKEAIQALGKYFGSKNGINAVRNSYAFHYDPKALDQILDDMEDGDEFDIYIADEHLNSLYYVSESIVAKAMLRELNADDLQEAFDTLYGEMAHVLGQMIMFVNGFMRTAAGRYFARNESNPSNSTLEASQFPVLEELRLPFFLRSHSKISGD